MARFQAMNDQRPAADRVGHADFMDHLKRTLDSPEGARAPKARKPYTISKQREKWTEDEHKLFLEALQQHGRAWRRIQEHIGSKTAVQIRSHAQKFFSKVIRESSGDSNSIAAPPQIHIPPPRPKRKPAHPYPRKLGNSLCKDASTIKQLEKPQLKIQLLSEQENCSPKSVLTAAQIGSQTMETEGSGSPASSVYMEEKGLTPSTSVGELGVQVALSKDATTSNGAACGIPEGPVLRLFGKRVVVNNLHQQPNSNTGNLKHAADMELDSSAETPTSGTGKFSSHGAEEAKTWSPWLTGTQQFVYYLPQGEVLSVHSACQFLSYSNGSISYGVLNQQTVASNKQQHQPSQASDCKFTRAEGSWAESITTSSSVPETTTQNSDSIESTQVNNDDDEVIPVPGSRKFLSTVPTYLRGFVPYRKCTAQSKMLQSQVPGEEADGDMTRLCL
ncbi:uncharacterized protein LOC120680713 isoform X1 [Panicum virgatum]|uniref:Uncharacterized protein n=1 Tax=Panicum virgatum TaxID=38727 RepID=A0A8T0QBU0_PANVG|nr:uncharacterized protein LOC120680713 isoform X1 [Panicum virgatum]KAG2568306.1 hypothetical protein PVAP13_7NG308300 [Panicum virgatum]